MGKCTKPASFPKFTTEKNDLFIEFAIVKLWLLTMRISFYCRANYLNEKNPNEVYTPADTIHQYLEHFVTFRKTGLTSQQQVWPLTKFFSVSFL